MDAPRCCDGVCKYTLFVWFPRRGLMSLTLLHLYANEKPKATQAIGIGSTLRGLYQPQRQYQHQYQQGYAQRSTNIL